MSRAASGSGEELGTSSTIDSQSVPGKQMPQSPYAIGWERVSAAFHKATARVELGEEPPEAPPEAKEFAQNTIVGLLFGIVYGGGRQWLADRAEGVPKAPAGMPSKLHEARFVADIQTNRLLGQLRGAIKGGMTFGGLASIFYGTQILSSIARGQRDHRDIMAAGLTTGAAFGIFMPGAPGMRLRSAFLGAGLGGLAGFPIGLLQEKLVQVMPDDPRDPKPQQPPAGGEASATEAPAKAASTPYKQRSYDSTAAVIAQLEASLQKDRPR